MGTPGIPVIDFGKLDILKVQDDDIVYDKEIGQLADELVDAFRGVGFVYLKNHGISPDLIEYVTSETDTFFKLPTDIKKSYIRQGDDNNGWISLEQESLNPDRPGDLKEAFNITPSNACNVWPDKEVPLFKELSQDILRSCEKLTSRILHLMAIGLKLENPRFLTERHRCDEASMTTLRYLYYPPITENIKVGQIRCGEHSDYGSITLLFQDHIGGLQVKSRDNEWVDARPVPGTVVVNVGDLMQRWTADELMSTRHRVVIPEEEVGKSITRRSLAYFAHPANAVMINCIDGSNKYEPITALDYCTMRFSVTY